LIAGVTPGMAVNATSATFPDWIGWTPNFTRIGFMIPDVDYSFDSASGLFSLLQPGDKFGISERFKADFNLRTDAVPVIDFGEKESIIANFVYYWYYRAIATQSTGIGEVKFSAEGAILDNPNQKMFRAWNEITERVYDFINFMDVQNGKTPMIYPEFVYQNRAECLYDFQFVNPIF